MSKGYTRKTLIALMGLLSSATTYNASAQSFGSVQRAYNNTLSNGKSVSFFHRLDIYGGLTMGSGNITSTSRYIDPANPNIISGDSRSQDFNYRSLSVGFSSYIPLTHLNSRACLGLSIATFYNNNSIEIHNPGFSSGSTTITSDVLKNAFVSIPIGVDYIYGGEASMNKGDKITLRGGLGVMPFINVSQFDSKYAKGSNLGILPYAKAELGFFAGIEWKIKTQVILGSRTLYESKAGDYDLQDAQSYSSFKASLQPAYSVGIAIMPFSMGWEGGGW